MQRLEKVETLVDLIDQIQEHMQKQLVWVLAVVMHLIMDLLTAEEYIFTTCLLYTSPSPRDGLLSRMPSSA